MDKTHCRWDKGGLVDSGRVIKNKILIKTGWHA